MFKKSSIIAVVFLQLGIIVGMVMDDTSNAVREVPVSIRASLAQVFEDHTNTMNKKVKQIIKNQNQLIDNEASDSSLYDKADTTGLTQIKIVDER